MPGAVLPYILSENTRKYSKTDLKPQSMKTLLSSLLCCISLFSLGNPISVYQPTCEYRVNPPVVSIATPRFGWRITAEATGISQTAYQIEIYQATGKKTGRIWNSGRVKSDQSQQVPYQGKATLKAGEKYRWRVRIWDNKGNRTEWSEPGTFRMAPDNLEAGAEWIGAIRREEAHIPQGRNYHGVKPSSEEGKRWQQTHPLSRRSILLRREFSFDKEIAEAVVYVSGLGHYELSINGQKIGDSMFNPMWSDYDKTVYYNVYDVTRQLQKENAIGVLLGNGFYNQQGGRYVKMQVSFGPPTLFLKMAITFRDGSRQTIVSDKSWQYSPSPLTFNDMYGGEDYDATLEQTGWDQPRFDASSWEAVVIQEAPTGRLRPQTAHPVRVMERFPVKTANPVGGSYLFDMGQNLSGFPVIRVSGKAGDKVRMIVGENLHPDGTVNQSQSGAPHYYDYTLKGDGEELWHPRFSYYGFRYIQVEGAKPVGSKDEREIPLIRELQSAFVYNAAPESGSFHCSNDIFNDAHRIILNAMKSNMHAVFTDCPHREKLGWLEEIHLNGPGLAYNFDLASFAPKIMQDIRDAQLPSGLVPDIAPEYVIFSGGFRDSPEWGSSAVLLPFLYYHYYGDRSLIEAYYDVMKRYVDYLTSTATGHIVSHGLGDWYDYNKDFSAGPSRNTPIALSATMHYFMDIDYLVQAAKMLGKSDDLQFYSSLQEKVKDAYNKTFFNSETKQYGTGSQASNAMSLFIGVVPPEERQAVLRNLVKDIEKHGYRLTTGDVGNRYLFQVLAENGLNEVMYKMHNHKEVPGYGFQIQFGATTLTEQWDPRNGNSWNHFMMGQIEEWFYKTLAGIRSENKNEEGFRHIVIAPQPVGDLTFVKAAYETPYGKISVDWEIEEELFILTVDIPVNCTATVFLPGDKSGRNTGSGVHHFIIRGYNKEIYH